MFLTQQKFNQKGITLLNRVDNNYKLKCISVDKNYMPINIDVVRHYVNASFTDDDRVLKNVIIESCKQAEVMTQKSILNRVWELTHSRPDMILKMPPVRKILAVFCRGPKKWQKVDLDNIEENFINDGERRVNILKCKNNQKFRVIYSAGATMFSKEHSYLMIDNRCAMPYSIHQLILKLCDKNYSKIRKTDFEPTCSLVSLCKNYCTGWNDPIF